MGRKAAQCGHALRAPRAPLPRGRRVAALGGGGGAWRRRRRIRCCVRPERLEFSIDVAAQLGGLRAELGLHLAQVHLKLRPPRVRRREAVRHHQLELRGPLFGCLERALVRRLPLLHRGGHRVLMQALRDDPRARLVERRLLRLERMRRPHLEPRVVDVQHALADLLAQPLERVVGLRLECRV
eukprot:1440454-Prymnesium_polylepis.1